MDALTKKTHERAIAQLKKRRIKVGGLLENRLNEISETGAKTLEEIDVAIKNLERLITPVEEEAAEVEVEAEKK